MRPPAHIKLFSLTRTEAGAALSALRGSGGASTSRRAVIMSENTQVCREKPWAGLPVGNLSSQRQTLLSKVRDPKNLLETTQLSGDKIGATVLAVCNVPYRNGRGQRVVHGYFPTFVFHKKCGRLTHKCTQRLVVSLVIDIMGMTLHCDLLLFIPVNSRIELQEQ